MVAAGPVDAGCPRRATLPPVEIRLASLDDAEAIRAIYNPAVLDSTATFDLRPRTLASTRVLGRSHFRRAVAAPLR